MSNPNWLDLSGTSNRYVQMYVKGFVDVSGGNITLRPGITNNNHLIVQGGDISLNGRLFINGASNSASIGDGALTSMNPGRILNVVGSNGVVCISRNSNTGGSPAVELKQYDLLATTLKSWWDFYDDAADNAYIRVRTPTAPMLGPVITFRNNGNVGIGTTYPEYKLDVNGPTRYSNGAIYMSNYLSSTVTPSSAAATAASWVNNGITWTASSSSSINASMSAYNAFNSTNKATYKKWASPNDSYANGIAASSSGTAVLTIAGTVNTNIGPVTGLTASGEWIQIQTSTPLVMQSFTLSSSDINGVGSTMPKTYFIVGSNDGTTWYPIQYGAAAAQYINAEATATPSIIVNTSATQTVGSSTITTTNFIGYTAQPYSYFRMYVSSIFGGIVADIGQWAITFQQPTGATLSLDGTTKNQLNLNGNLSLNGSLLGINNMTPTTALDMQGTLRISTPLAATITPSIAGITSASWSSAGVTWTSSASSSPSNPPYLAFQTAGNNSWQSGFNIYVAATGVYTGSTTTYVSSTTSYTPSTSIKGEWLQIQSNTPVVMNSYTLNTGDSLPQRMPATYTILGSNDGIQWYQLQSCTFTALPVTSATSTSPQTTSSYTVSTSSALTQTQNSNNSTIGGGLVATRPFTYFRIVVQSLIGTSYGIVNQDGPFSLAQFGWTINFNAMSAAMVTASSTNAGQLDVAGPVALRNSSSVISPNTTAATQASWTNNNVTWTASASSVLGGGAAFVAFSTTSDIWHDDVTGYAFDTGIANGNFSTTVFTNGSSGATSTYYGQWLQIQSSNAASIQSFYFGGRVDFPNRLPAVFYIVGSNTGTEPWTPIFKGDTTSTTGAILSGTVSLSGLASSGTISNFYGTTLLTYTTYGNLASSFTYFRLIVSELCGNDNTCNIGEWWLTFTPMVSTVSLALHNTIPNQLLVNGITAGRGGGAIDSNTAFGLSALNANTTGVGNSAFGVNTLLMNTTGYDNNAFGQGTLRYNTTGLRNSAFARLALHNNTTGNDNSAFGVQALYTNTTGNYNSAVGLGALYTNTTGNYNSAVGHAALYTNTTGGQNTAVGHAALQFNTTGILNTAVGQQALYSNTTGNYNTSLGQGALLNATSNDNTAVGIDALRDNTTGHHNTAVGCVAGYAHGVFPNRTGNNNTYLGYNTGATGDNFSNSTAIGADARIIASNQIVLGGTGNEKVYMPGNSIYALQWEAPATVDGATIPQYGLSWQGSNIGPGYGPTGYLCAYGGLRFVTQGQGVMTIKPGGNVGIGMTAPSYKLDVAGQINSNAGGVSFTANNASYSQYGTNSAYPTNRFNTIAAGDGVYALINSNGGLYVAGQGLTLTGQSLYWGSQTNTAPTSFASQIQIDGGRSALAGVNHGQIRFYTANVQQMTINESGNVGIGTANPQATLDIVGSVALRNSSSISPNTTAATGASWKNNGVTWTASASSVFINEWHGYKAFNTIYGGAEGWHDDTSGYVSSTGVANGNFQTTVFMTGYSGGTSTYYGQWLQLQSSIPASIQTFYFGSRLDSNPRLPGVFYIVGSNTGTGTWTPIFKGNTTSTTGATLSGTVSLSELVSSGTISNFYGTTSLTYTTYGNLASSFTYFRLIVSEICGNDITCNIGEWGLTFTNLQVLDVAGSMKLGGDTVPSVGLTFTKTPIIPTPWVAVGIGTNTIATSTDGIDWTARGATIFTTGGYGVAWNGTMWVAVGYGTNTIATSTNGIDWTGRGTSIFSAVAVGVAWNGTMWVAVGEGGNTIATSTDGITWTGRGQTIFTRGNAAAWNGTMWVALGQGTNSIATSTDGITWTGRGNTIFSGYGLGVAWNGSMWVAVGNGAASIATSTDGITWTARDITIFSSGLGVAWNGTMWVVVGQSTNTIATSTDGITWTARGGGIFMYGYGVAWNGTMWVAVGQGTNHTIATSTDGITWTGRGKSIFTSGRSVVAAMPATNSSVQLSMNSSTRNQLDVAGGLAVSGYVGIGMTNPACPLDVRGSVLTGAQTCTARFTNSNNNGQLYLCPGIYQATSSDANCTTYEIPGTGVHYFWDNVLISGTMSAAGTKAFNISHPLDPSNTRLIHASVEAPRHDLIYSGTVSLINGVAIVNIDRDSCPNHPMRDGTFEALTRDVRIYLQNNETFDRVKGNITGGTLNIECENNASSASIDWMVIADRKDDILKNSKFGDENGYLITERNTDEELYLSDDYRVAGSFGK
jgi:hypothetical protein